MQINAPIFFVTGSEDKFRECKLIVPELEMLNLDLPEIQETDSSPIIKEKLSEAIKRHDGDLIVEDSSLEFTAIAPLPGPLIKWFFAALGNAGLSDLAQRLDSQKAVNKVTIGYYAAAKKEIKFFETAVGGKIVPPRGTLDFGWGPIFQPDGSEKTFGEMTKPEKEKFSARSLTIQKFREYLISNFISDSAR